MAVTLTNVAISAVASQACTRCSLPAMRYEASPTRHIELLVRPVPAARFLQCAMKHRQPGTSGQIAAQTEHVVRTESLSILVLRRVGYIFLVASIMISTWHARMYRQVREAPLCALVLLVYEKLQELAEAYS
eukprot:6187540-Pleurochrysis_carterae.AAC.1